MNSPYWLPIIALSALAIAPLTASSAPSGTNSEITGQPRNQQWHLDYLSAAEAHRVSKGEEVTVAVLDTGADPHPDLRENLLAGFDLLKGGSNDWQDNDGHGTAMAGLIGAHNEAGGAMGIAPRAKIIPIKFKENNQEGEAEDLTRAIKYAIGRGVDIISISSGGNPDIAELKAIQEAAHADIVIVAAAGNKPANQSVRYPAAYPGVIAVGGVDKQGRPADVSVSGDEIDVVAPAVEIYSTGIDGEYRVGTGTSGAAAIVAGAAALVRAKYPYLPADEVAHRLTATAIDKGPPGRDDQYGYGVIDLVAALTADVPPRGFESMPATAPGGGSTTAADGPRADPERDASVRGLITLGVLLAAGGAWAWFVRRRRRSDDPPPRISR